MTYPSAQATGMLSRDPKLLLSGKIVITCSSHLLRVELGFSGEKCVSGSVIDGESDEVVATISGDWRGVVEICREGSEGEILLDMSGWNSPRCEKIVAPVSEQGDLESRRVWRFVTRSLAGYESSMDGDTYKRKVEDFARRRYEKEQNWQPSFFEVNDENVVFKYTLVSRV